MFSIFIKSAGKLWKNKWLILQGIWNKIFGKHKDVAKYRENICKKCPYYDKYGETEQVVVKGKPACSICGCNISYLVSSMGATCSREEIGREPLWVAEK